MLFNRVALCVAAVLVAAASPEPAPRRFMTPHFQLTASIPAGLFHCPNPVGWAGADQGISLYLEKPKACDADTPAASAEEAGRLPQIRFYYVSNGSPRTNADLHKVACSETLSSWPKPMTMLGEAAATCFENHGGTIALAVGTLYRQMVAPSRLDSQAWLILQTTALRYPYDLKIFEAILATITVCRSSDRPPQPPRPTCQSFTGR
jgi:hypothetical protein